MVLLDEKYQAYIKFSGKDGYVTVCYFLSGEIEEVEVERCREVPLLEETRSWSGNHYVVTVATINQEESIIVIEAPIKI